MNQVSATNIHLRNPTYNELPYIRHLWACEETNKYLGGPYFMSDENSWYQRWVEPGTMQKQRCNSFSPAFSSNSAVKSLWKTSRLKTCRGNRRC